MDSKKPVEPLDTFEQDVPITPEDNEALWRVRELDHASPEEYSRLLEAFRARSSANGIEKRI